MSSILDYFSKINIFALSEPWFTSQFTLNIISETDKNSWVDEV